LAFRIELSPDAVEHLDQLSARNRKTILDVVEKQLSHEPVKVTRQRKPMRPNPVAPWELRVGAYRVYYDVRDDPEQVVLVRAIGVKARNRLRIGKEEIKL
jgi:mRNA-degrading endonuclease RelE of RelBE toxin-antitoxin system